MNGFQTRVRLFDIESKKMLPSAPLYKCNFFETDTSKYILMFSTGYEDKNGKEIYESDLCKLYSHYGGFWSKDSAEVIFSTAYVGGWILKGKNGGLNIGTRTNHIEVIGNIYETK